MEPILLYIDPASGSILAQGLIAAIFGSMVFFRRMVTSFFMKLCFWKKTPGTTESTPAVTPTASTPLPSEPTTAEPTVSVTQQETVVQ